MGQHSRFWCLLHIHKCHINSHAGISGKGRGLKFDPSLHVHPYHVYARVEAVASLCLHIASSEPLLPVDAKSSKSLCAGRNFFVKK